MPYSDPEKRREKNRKWREANHEAALQATRKWQRSEEGKQKRAAYKAAKKAELLADKKHEWHGTVNGYGMGCRCIRCIEAQATYRKQRTYSSGSLAPRRMD